MGDSEPGSSDAIVVAIPNNKFCVREKKLMLLHSPSKCTSSVR